MPYLATIRGERFTLHKLARLVDSLLKHGQGYVAQTLEDYELQHQERLLRCLHRKARELGYELVKPGEPAAPAVTG
jgi:ribosomal 50S subunit-associated protein YjgA (DUF615 family)